MKQAIRISLPFTNDIINSLHVGDTLLLNGTIYTARDEAHLYLSHMIANNEPLPFDLDGCSIYYTGPCPAKPGMIIGSAGPTTSTRMDKYSPLLMEHGLKAMIGKGPRNESVIKSIISNNCIYLAATGGIGALLSNSIVEAEVVAFPELGAEAIHKLKVVDFPCTVAIDNGGNDIYKIGKKEFEKKV